MLEAATDQVRAHTQAEFVSRVEAARMGAIFAHDGKQHSKWRGTLGRASGRGRALAGESLELHVATLAFSRPDLVKRVGA